MAMQLMEGFELRNYAAWLVDAGPWEFQNDAAAGSQFKPGRFGGTGLWTGSNSVRPELRSRGLTADDIWIMGCSLATGEPYNGGSPKPYLMRVFDGSTPQFSMHMVPGSAADTMKLAAYRGTLESGTLLAESSDMAADGAWRHMETKVTIGNSGSWEVRVDGVAFFSGSGDTQATASASGNKVGFMIGIDDSLGPDGQIDDIVIMNGLTSRFNDFIGPRMIEGVVASGAGGLTEWSPTGSGLNWQNVDDGPFFSGPSDSDYNESGTTGQRDLYEFEDLSFANNSIDCVQVHARFLNDTAGTSNVRVIFRDSILGDGDAGTPIAVTATSGQDTRFFQLGNPAGGTWDVDEFQNGQWGARYDS